MYAFRKNVTVHASIVADCFGNMTNDSGVVTEEVLKHICPAVMAGPDSANKPGAKSLAAVC